MSDQIDLVEQLFEAALALDPSDRAAYLVRECHDPELRRVVEELLAEDERAGSFLERPLFELNGKANATPHSPAAATPPTNGDRPSSAGKEGMLEEGQTLVGRFLIVRFIAKGGMGEVYEVEDRLLQNDHVALKLIRPHIAGDPDSQQRFEREVLLARKVVHPNLCPIYDIYRCEQPPPGFLFLTMKLLPGETVAARLKRPGSISIEEALVILRQMVDGLAAIHDAGVVHRDIKPNNILLDGTGKDVRVCITDFGLARVFEGEETVTAKGMVAGTPGYIAPELMNGHPPSQASDLFAFGVVLHEIFAGEKPPPTSSGSSAQISSRLNASGAPSFCVQLVKECLNIDPKRRCAAFERVMDLLSLKRHPRIVWTRRQFATAAAATACTLAGGAWWKWDDIEDLLHPLPGRRFIALLNWPRTSDNHVAPMLTGVLGAIKSELSRMEAFDRNLFVISPEDVGRSVLPTNRLREVCDPLGANLVLAASGLADSKSFHLLLRLLNPVTGVSLRERKLSCSLADITSLPGKAVQGTASLLHLTHQRSNKQTAPETQSVAAFTAFQSAETLIKQPNDKGLEAAIEKYKEAVDIDPDYAVAHAKLALAYGRLNAIHNDPGALALARGNADRALALDPALVDARLSRAYQLEYTGDVHGALDEIARALALDPSNPSTLLFQASMYRRLDRWADAEQTYNRILQTRPNNWVAYNELGVTLHYQAKYQQAIQAFSAASVAAPGSSMALSNLGLEYLEVGDFARASDCLKRSLVLQPDSDQAAVNWATALRCQGKVEEALPFAQKAVQLSPSEDTNWLELGECYSSLHNHKSEAKSAYLRAAQETEARLKTDAEDGPSWMLLALYQVKAGDPQNAAAYIKKAESLGADDLDSQLYKARILELTGKREDALTTLSSSFKRGASVFEVDSFPDLQALRKDPRYRQMLQPKARSATNR
jgi:tetratricopeptide (TPR) repeat protein